MNKADFVKNVKNIVSEELEGVTLKDTTIFVDAFLKAVEKGLVAGEKIHFVGFGTFDVAERAERKGRNPKDGSEITIPASKAPRFKAGKVLKDAVNK